MLKRILSQRTLQAAAEICMLVSRSTSTIHVDLRAIISKIYLPHASLQKSTRPFGLRILCEERIHLCHFQALLRSDSGHAASLKANSLKDERDEDAGNYDGYKWHLLLFIDLVADGMGARQSECEIIPALHLFPARRSQSPQRVVV